MYRWEWKINNKNRRTDNNDNDERFKRIFCCFVLFRFYSFVSCSNTKNETKMRKTVLIGCVVYHLLLRFCGAGDTTMTIYNNDRVIPDIFLSMLLMIGISFELLCYVNETVNKAGMHTRPNWNIFLDKLLASNLVDIFRSGRGELSFHITCNATCSIQCAVALW